MKKYFELFFTFMKMGVITFGGGYAMMPVIERELINKRQWVTNEEVLDYYTIAQITPGIIAVNVSTFVGYKKGGIVGGVLATVGFISIPMCLVIIIGLLIQNFVTLPVVAHAFAGVKIAVAALILGTVIKMARQAIKDIFSIAICVIAFIMIVIFGASPVVLIICFGLLGIVLYRPGRKPICR
jgi:chromate transporter